MVQPHHVDAITRAVLKESPLPSSFDSLDTRSRIRVEREAIAIGVAPRAHYDRILKRAAEGAAFDPGAIASVARLR
jgi:hypothetical protein